MEEAYLLHTFLHCSCDKWDLGLHTGIALIPVERSA